MGGGRAEGSSALGEGGQAAILLTPDTDGMHVCIFLKFETWRFVCRGLTLQGSFSSLVEKDTEEESIFHVTLGDM